MFLKLSIKSQIAILCIKIKEIDFSKDHNENDKKLMKSFYQKKLKAIQPNTKF
jgi:hypothetical protein